MSIEIFASKAYDQTEFIIMTIGPVLKTAVAIGNFALSGMIAIRQ